MASPANRLAVAARLGGAVGLALAALTVLHTPATAAVHRAALVVVHGTSWTGARILWRCVEFTQDTINGLSLLERAGMNSGQPPQVYDWGGGAATVCQVNGEPRQIPDRCFGPTSGANWSDWAWSKGGWTPRSTGATGYAVRDGDLEGWTYSNGFGSPPAATTFAQVCSTPASSPQRSVAPSHAAAPTTKTPSSPSAAPVTAALPSPSPSPSTLPDTAATAVAPLAARPAPAGAAMPAYLLFGGGLLVLVGLAAWSLLRRAP